MCHRLDGTRFVIIPLIIIKKIVFPKVICLSLSVIQKRPPGVNSLGRFCRGGQVAHLSGARLAAGATLHNPRLLSGSKCPEVKRLSDGMPCLLHEKANGLPPPQTRIEIIIPCVNNEVAYCHNWTEVARRLQSQLSTQASQGRVIVNQVSTPQHNQRVKVADCVQLCL